MMRQYSQHADTRLLCVCACAALLPCAVLCIVRPSAGPCDVRDFCSGYDATCPDEMKEENVICKCVKPQRTAPSTLSLAHYWAYA
jgi:hypothetical protein